jgi:hypothetical protein
VPVRADWMCRTHHSNRALRASSAAYAQSPSDLSARTATSTGAHPVSSGTCSRPPTTTFHGIAWCAPTGASRREGDSGRCCSTRVCRCAATASTCARPGCSRTSSRILGAGPGSGPPPTSTNQLTISGTNAAASAHPGRWPVPSGGAEPAHSGHAPVEPTGVRPDHWCLPSRRRSSAFSICSRRTSSWLTLELTSGATVTACGRACRGRAG